MVAFVEIQAAAAGSAGRFRRRAVSVFAGPLLTVVHMHRYDGDMDGPMDPLACHCLTTRQLARHVSKIYERHLAEVGITSTQFAILMFLQQRSEQTMSELSREMVMDRTTLLRAIKPLQRDGLVTQARRAAGTRQLAFVLSRQGWRKIEESLPVWAAAQEEYEGQIGAARAERLRRDFLDLTRPA
jgi:DNA-binding MarR family transcriptional regulator